MKEKTIWQSLTASLSLIRGRSFTFAGVAILLQLLLSLGAQGMTLLFRLVLFTADQTSLDKTNIAALLTSPVSILLLTLFIFLFGFFFLFEMSVLVQVIYTSKEGRQLSFRSVLAKNFRDLKHIRGGHFLSFLLYLLLTLPIAGIVMGSSLTESLYIPEFITGEFTKTTMGTLGVFGAGLLLFFLNIRLIYTVPLVASQDLSFTAAMKESWRKTRKGLVKLLASLTLLEILLGGFFALLVMTAVLLFAWLDPQGQNLLAGTIFLTLIRLLTFLFAVFSKIALMALLLDSLGQEVATAAISDRTEAGRLPRSNRLVLSLSVFFLVSQTLLAALDLYGLELNKDQKIIAHRGAVSQGVENSLEALEAAAQQKADLAEMDILLTKDHQFVVMHDYNLQRLAGIDKRVQDMTLAELQGLEIKQDGHSSRIPSFDAYVARAKELNIKLLVELKPHGGEPDNYADIFIAKMRQLGIVQEYQTMSLDLKLMEKIEQKAPEIQTGYVIPIQFGSFAQHSLDFYAIEDFSYNSSLLDQAHEEGKKLYVWTINDEQKITEYLQRSIDGIITDKPDQANQAKEELSKQNSYLDRLLRLLNFQEK